ncbi:MAG TPA: TetR/AcrR family transcriptional regulator [Acidimicrobiales bacterium]|nr:TetR/AcrR family transcriptional regulator [Acidimicrobiales bacterium]
MARRLTQRGKDRRDQLMAYATERFADQGYHPTSVSEIVAGLGVGKGVFYWYFDSKEQLFLEILRDAQTDLRRRQQQAIADEGDPIRRIELGLRASMAWSEAHRDHNKLIQFAATEAAFGGALRRGQDIAVADVVKHVKEAVAEGRISDVDPDTVAHAMVGVVGHLVRTFIYERGEPAEAVADQAVAFCLHGLRGGVTPASSMPS